MFCILFIFTATIIFNSYIPKVLSHRMSTSSNTFPDSLEGFGYAFNDAGQLRQIDAESGAITEEPFKFDVSDNTSYNQQHYEALGESITKHVYQLLLDLGLHKIDITSSNPLDSSFIFGTRSSFENTQKLLILIHGSGVVRAGQWSRSLIINHSIDHGTQIPYVKRAKELGYEVLITNTNHNYRIENGERVALAGNESPEAHIESVWKQMIEPVKDSIKSFAIVAHSYGGIVTLNLAKNHENEFLEKCFAIGFTDSVHSARILSADMLQWFKNNARNWVTSSEPLDTELEASRDIPCYSAGHTKHEWTSWACIDGLFKFVEEKYKQISQKNEL